VKAFAALQALCAFVVVLLFLLRGRVVMIVA
jgi:hypothetical protein